MQGPVPRLSARASPSPIAAVRRSCFSPHPHTARIQEAPSGAVVPHHSTHRAHNSVRGRRLGDSSPRRRHRPSAPSRRPRARHRNRPPAGVCCAPCTTPQQQQQQQQQRPRGCLHRVCGIPSIRLREPSPCPAPPPCNTPKSTNIPC
ncbi:hypothetical protein K491DRAFT_326120 [Lophiostoma macrostomum CBS 122681]|uniref:Uncharacterized protein n=1 Tax=Lophiostoma macrostomum CBS 122681 TaxID=1314788 RepID=A0A6A6TC63_9PLEO|nr:hypothetical protein K491DRAFT_326120 [Lophiostoma macrostomum CBS 122681]